MDIDMDIDMDQIEKDFRSIAIKALTDGLTLEESMESLIMISPGFKDDKIFNDIYPIIFRMEECRNKIK
jgi:hypothetical protein